MNADVDLVCRCPEVPIGYLGITRIKEVANKNRKIQDNASHCRILGNWTRIKVASFDHPTTTCGESHI